MTNWIVCPVRDNLHLTVNAVDTFLKQDIGDIRILLLDNGELDATWEWWKRTNAPVDYMRNRPPQSVAASWNLALRVVFRDEEHALVANNDVLLRPDTYRLLLEEGGGFVTAVGNQDPKCIDVLTPPKAAPRPHPDFSCYLIRKWVYEKVGPFDEKFLNAFCEDWDYHCRLHKLGVDAHCIDLPFYHIGSATVKTINPDIAQEIHAQAARNRDYFEEKWGFRGGTPEYYEFFNKNHST